jgi:hypothetical protein
VLQLQKLTTIRHCPRGGIVLRRCRVVVPFVGLIALLCSLTYSQSASAKASPITFTATFCEPIPPATLPSVCERSNGGPGQSYDIVLSWSTTGTATLPVDVYNTAGYTSSGNAGETNNGSGYTQYQTADGTTNIAVAGGGDYDYSIEMNLAGTPTFASASVDIPDLSPPTITPYANDSTGQNIDVDPYPDSSGNYVDLKTGSPPQFSWTAGTAPPWDSGATMVTEVSPPGLLPDWKVASSPFVLPPGTFSATSTSVSYNVRSCVNSLSTFCSASAAVTAQLTGAQFQGGNRQFVSAGGDTTVTWQNPSGEITPGNLWELVSPALPGGGVFTGNTSYQIPTPTAGTTDVWLLTCNITSLSPFAFTCQGPTTSGTAPVSGTIEGLPSDGSYVASESNTAVTIVNGSTSTPVVAPASGILNGNASVTNGMTVTEGEDIFSVSTQTAGQELVVGSEPNDGSSSFENADFTYEPWTDGFNSTTSQVYSTADALGTGNPDGTAFDGSGNVYWDGEFNTALGEVDTSTGAVTSDEIPLAYSSTTSNLTGGGPYYPQTTPFANIFNDKDQTNESALSEQAIYADGRIWEIQGGDFGVGGVWNHSRIISFSPTGKTLDKSLDDTNYNNSFCAYSVEGNNNVIYGLAWDGKRIWFSEFGNGGLSWFNPKDLTCDSMLNYSQPDPTNPLDVDGAHLACSATVTTNCINTIPQCAAGQTSDCVPNGIDPINLTADPDGDQIWFSGPTISSASYIGGLGEITYKKSNGTFESAQDWTSSTTPPYPPPTPLSHWSTGWTVAADSTNVYEVEGSGLDLVMFNKATGSFTKILLPALSSSDSALSLALDNGDLYFLIGDPWGGGSELGYVNIARWEAGDPSGTIYTGLSSFNAPGSAQTASSQPTALSVDSQTGAIAYAEYARREIYVLQPIT